MVERNHGRQRVVMVVKSWRAGGVPVVETSTDGRREQQEQIAELSVVKEMQQTTKQERREN